MNVKQIRNRCVLVSSIYTLLIVMLCGCSSRQLQISIIASNDANYGGNPVVVRLYQLKSDVNFKRTTLETFWDNDVGTLGSDLLEGPIEVIIRPEETRKLQKIQIHKDAIYLAAAADFYRPDQNRWRHVIIISEYKGKQIYVLVGDDKIAISIPR